MKKPQMLYVYDALCGWCYGFSGVMKQLQEKYADQADFVAYSGGMITGERVGPIANMAHYIESAYKRVEEMSGVTFGDAFLDGILRKGTYISNSEKPGIALTIFKEYLPQQSVLFAHDIQNAFYRDGQDLNLNTTYLPLVAKYGLDPATFEKRLQDPTYQLKTEKEFEMVKSWGVSGFPTLIFYTGKQATLLTHGFQSFELMDKMIAGIFRP